MSIDVLSFGETMLRLTAPTGTRLETAQSFQAFVGGTESNTLSCLARLGCKATWLSALPDNPAGRHVEGELQRHGVDTRYVVRASQNSRLGTFYVEELLPPLGVQVYYDRAHSACARIDPERLDYTLVDQARLLHLTGITPALSQNCREVFARLLARAREKQVQVSFDVNYRGKLWSSSEAALAIEEACRQADILFCTRADATELWEFTGSAEEILWQMRTRFANSNPRKRFVLTDGSAGSSHLHNDVYTSEQALPTEGNVRFGSGDAFAAGYLYAYLGGSIYSEMKQTYNLSPLRVGNALAALKRCIPGDIAVVTPGDVRAVLQTEDGGRFR